MPVDATPSIDSALTLAVPARKAQLERLAPAIYHMNPHEPTCGELASRGHEMSNTCDTRGIIVPWLCVIHSTVCSVLMEDRIAACQEN